MTLNFPAGVARAALLDVARAGALRAAAIADRHGPRPAWHGLVTAGLLRSLRTVRGEVLVLSRQGHAFLEAHGYAPPDRVTGIERAVDRSYQNDALARLEAEGYRVTYAHPQGGPLGAGRIVRYTVEVPATQLEFLEDHWPEGKTPPHAGGPFHESLGRPSLYATCSRGGRGSRAIRELVEQTHDRDLDTWRAPLIVMVPQMTPEIRSYVRRITAERTRQLDRAFGPGLIHGRPRYEALDIQVL